MTSISGTLPGKPSQDAVAEATAALLREGRNQEAIAYLQSQPSLSQRAMTYLCDAHFQSRDWARAHQVVRALLALNATDAYHRKLEAKIFNNWGKHQAAQQLIEA